MSPPRRHPAHYLSFYGKLAVAVVVALVATGLGAVFLALRGG
jgi:hypothetical protein